MIIGANSVVIKSINQNEVWAGIPAKKIKIILFNINMPNPKAVKNNTNGAEETSSNCRNKRD